MLYKAELFSHGFSFLEGPRWRGGYLWVSDMRAQAVLRIDESGAATPVATVPGWPSGLGFLPSGDLIVVAMNDKVVHRVQGAELVPYSDLSDLVDSPLNDMLVTREGRAYVGDIGYDFYADQRAAPGNITMIDVDGAARRVAADLKCPNGMALSTDGSVLYVAESFSNRLLQFDCASDGTLSNKRVLLDLSGEVLDGICLDAEGNIWVASYTGGRFLHVTSAGRIIREVSVAGRNAVACQLGGADGKTLFCLTYTGTHEQMTAGYPASQIEIAKVEVPAAGTP